MLARGLVVAVLVAVACSPVSERAQGGRVVVLAASSLRAVLVEVEADLDQRMGGADVAVTVDGSSALASAVIEGAPGDVLISADEATMQRLIDAGEVERGATRVIATNALVIAVPRGNPRDVRGLGDLSAGDLIVSLCRAEVPCGAYAEQVFERAGVSVPGAGREASVAAVLAKVRLGEADAGVVYRTDVGGAEGIEGVELPVAHNIEARYVAAVLTDAENPTGARDLVEHLIHPETQTALRRFGFGAP